MRALRFIASALTSAAIAAPVSADVTIRSRMVQEGSGSPVTDVTAALGLLFASEMTVSIAANAPDAERHKIASHTMEVTSISTESIPDSIFEIPPGYTVTRR
jgi:hypothetical protein